MATLVPDRRARRRLRAQTDIGAKAAGHFATAVRKYASPLALARAVDPSTRTSPALEVINQALVDLVDGKPGQPNALMVFMPPQEGKSQLCSRRFTEWVLTNDPSTRVAIVGYEQDVAVRWGRDIKRDVTLAPEALPLALRTDSKAAGRWETRQGGGVYCVGIGGPLTGRPVDVLIIDDPVKDRAAAESEKLRNTAWDWWESVALTRLAPGAVVVVVQTRWHEDDLSGRLQARPSSLVWRKVSIPAIATEADDPLGRPAGVELQSVRGRVAGYFRALQASMTPYVYSGVYQQTPVAAEGNFFRRPTFRYWRPAEPWPGDYRERIDLEGRLVTLADGWIFATCDVAGSTRTTADYTVVSVWCQTVEGDLVLLDRAREQVATHQHFEIAEPLLVRWQCQVMYVEHGFFSSTLVDDARDAGWPIAEVTADTDKVTRAIPAAGRTHAGRVWFPAQAEWLDEWTNELASFPNGSHDDQVDTLSYAVRVVVSDWTPAQQAGNPGVSQHDRAVAAASRADTGNAGELDIMNVQY